jgi:paraquat-inducible protein B
MARRTNTRAIGAFVVGAAALTVLAIVVLGSGNIFAQHHTYVLFFKNNINGLRVGAPVKFNGVKIGEVERIMLNLDLPYKNETVGLPAQVRIPVIISIDEKTLVSHGGHINLSDPRFLRRAIADGLRAQLGLESLLTGMLYIDLGMHPNAPLNLVLPPDSRYQEIPTIPNALQQVQQSATRFFSNLDRVDLVKLVDSVNATLDSLNRILGDHELHQTFAILNLAARHLGEAANSIQHLADSTNRAVGPLSRRLESNSANANRALEQAAATMEDLRMTLGPGSPLIYQTDRTLIDMSNAARAINRLANFLDENPSALIRGRDLTEHNR